MQNTCKLSIYCLAALGASSFVFSQAQESEGFSLFQSHEVGLPDWLTPSLHIRTLYQTGAEEGSTEGVPEDGWTMQSIEPGLTIEWGDYRLMGLAHIFGSLDGEGDWDIELDEATFDTPWLPWDGTLRLGQMRAAWGLHNDVHQHGWAFAEQNLMHSRFLGDEGLMLRGFRADWQWDRVGSSTRLSIAGGESVPHNHSHGGDHDHEHEHEEVAWDGLTGSMRLAQTWMPGNRTSYTVGLSGLIGEQEGGDTGQLYGIDLGWSKEFDAIDRFSINLEAGAHRFRSMGHGAHEEEHDDHGDHDEHEHEGDHHDEHDEHHDEHEHEEGHHDEHGHAEEEGGSWQWEPAVSVVALAQINEHLDLAARAEWIGGVDGAEREQRWRFSPAMTWYPDEDRNFSVRTQYSYETGSSFDEHRLMLQLGFSWGDL